MNTEQERADFEAFASQHGLCVTEDGDLYRSHVVAWMWKAWQARAALQSHEYSAAIGGAGQAYLDRFKNAHALPAEFRWSELWAVMCVAANTGRTDATQSHDRADAERLDWLLRKLPGDAIRYCVGVLDDTADIDEFREAIDQARRIEGDGNG